MEKGVKHSFRSDKGCVFEEVSGTHYVDDSYYDDGAILNNSNRKTEMTFWADWLYGEMLETSNANGGLFPLFNIPSQPLIDNRSATDEDDS